MREGAQEGKEKRKCRICGWEEKTRWEHVVKRCMDGGKYGTRENKNIG